jgi:ribosomal protein S18 acetylase RimI-like enzyme
MDAGIVLRRATAQDALDIGATFDAAVRAGWTYLGALAEHPMFDATHWKQLVADHAEPDVLIVATDPVHGVVGFTAVHPRDGEMYLLFVHPEYSGRGIGRRLLDTAHDELRAAGCRQVFLYTHEQNIRAQAVYMAAGYRPDGTVRESEFRGTHLREPRFVTKL